MYVSGNFNLTASFDDIGADSFAKFEMNATPSKLANFLSDGVDFPEIMAAEKKGGGGEKGKIEVGKGDTVVITCDDGSRPQVKTLKDGVEINCPDKGGGDKGKTKEEPTRPNNPGTSPILY